VKRFSLRHNIEKKKRKEGNLESDMTRKEKTYLLMIESFVDQPKPESDELV
jgi:hypothetical protein